MESNKNMFFRRENKKIKYKITKIKKKTNQISVVHVF